VLHVHRSERADGLVAALAAVLAVPPGDPMAHEVIAVPAKGVERWLMQRLSHTLGARAGHDDGICANVDFPHPSRLVGETLAAASGVDADTDPWRRKSLLWTVLDVIDDCVGEPWCATLTGHLGIGDDAHAYRRNRRLATAAHLAALFDSYAENRPAMLLDWADGSDTDGAGGIVAPDLAWQAELWRRVAQRIGTDSPAQRLPVALQRIREDAPVVELPTRLSVFGPTRLTTTQLQVLAAIALHRDIHLWLPHPSAPLWDRIADLAGSTAPVRRRDDPTIELPRNPLLASLGRDARELQLQLAATADPATQHHHHPVEPRADSVLGRLQQSLQADVDDAELHVIDPLDRSIAVHACHGPARQVEILREVLVGLLAADPTLEPRDLLVMCPNIETYAPLISATFGLDDDDTERHPGHRLRVRLADRSLRQTNPLLATIAALLDLAAGRVTASKVLDLASTTPVRRRFRFSDDDLERLQGWVATSGIRWGLDAAHRKPYGLEQLGQNTWQAGLDRILLGAAMAEDDLRWVGLALPLDDVDSTDIDLAGRFAELIDRLTTVLDDMVGERPLSTWLETLQSAVDSLTDVRHADTWQKAQARYELSDIADAAGERATHTELSIADVHALLTDRLAGRPTRANFRTGNLTMCSMVPMRSVPHRVVCLLGLDDGAFPRTTAVDGDDILGREPCVGERDPRSEDRQLLLDAVLAAREHLVVLYTGADPRTNAKRPPAVPLGEILDAVDALGQLADGSPVRDHVVIHHPLQPFDARNFTVGALGTPGPFSFDRHSLRGAQRAVSPREQRGPMLAGPLDAAPLGDVALEDLISFLEQPAKAFLRQRLGVTVAYDEAELDDALQVELSKLKQWSVGNQLLKARLGGATVEACRQAEWRRGDLPPRGLGQLQLDAILREVEPLVAASATLRSTEGTTADVVVDLDGRRVSGTVGTIHGDVLLRVEYSRLGAKHRLRAWVQLLALAASFPGTPWTAVTIGRRSSGDGALSSTLGPIDPADARRQLADLVDLRDRGLRQPLPMAAKTSEAYASKRNRGQSVASAVNSAGYAWNTRDFPGEQEDEAQQILWGSKPSMAMLRAASPWPDESAADETNRFGVLARRLWAPILASERLVEL
jgi:exodeoxyribonuclease V gamma subunit